MYKIAMVKGSTHNVGNGIASSLSDDGFFVITTSQHGQETKDISENLPGNLSEYHEVLGSLIIRKKL